MNNYIWIMLWYINLFRSLWSFRRQKLLKMMFALFHKKPQRIGRCLKNHFPSNSFRHCVFPTLKENKQHCLKIKTNFVTYVRFFNLRQFGAESYFCFSLETMWLRKQGTSLTPIVRVICWMGRGRISRTQNDLYTNRRFVSEEMLNITVVCLSSEALWSFVSKQCGQWIKQGSKLNPICAVVETHVRRWTHSYNWHRHGLWIKLVINRK